MASDEPTLRRLLHVFATFDPGGPQIRTVEMLPLLGTDLVHDIVAVDGRLGAAQRLAGGLSVQTTALTPTTSSLRQLWSLASLMRCVRPDLVLTYNWGAILGTVAARLAGVPFVHHEEVVPPEERQRHLRRRDWLRRVSLRRAAAVVVPSTHLHQRSRERWGIQTPRLRRIDNGVDLHGRLPRQHTASSIPIVGTVAHARVEKNRIRLLQAFAELRHRTARLILVGQGPTQDAEQLRSTELGIADRVIPVIDPSDLRPHYADMDVFALASDDEQMPLAILEAMAHGLPVVATNVGEIAAMLPTEQLRFLVAPEINAPRLMAARIDELLADTALRSRLGNLNRKHVEQRFDLRGVARTYRALYDHCFIPTTSAEAS